MTITVVKNSGLITVETASIVNIETFSECDFIQSFRYTTSDVDDPQPIDLHSFALQMMVRKRASSAAALIDASTVNGRIVINFEDTGVFTVRLPFSELNVLSEDVYVHSLVGTYQDAAFTDFGVGVAISPITVPTTKTGVDTALALGSQAGPAFIRQQIWRGTMTHKIGPTR